MSQDSDRRLIAVSNRVAKPKQGNAAAGGLAVGILGALSERGGMWFGWGGQLVASEATDPEIDVHGNIEYATIALNERDYERYYNGYSNRVMWPICHYLNGFVEYESEDFEGYVRVNQVFARKLAPLLKPTDVIWVHDYHLIPLAAELRSAGVTNPIGFFLHVPFPSFEAIRAIPHYDYLLRSLCAYDVVGFQTQSDVEAFESCLRQPMFNATLDDTNAIQLPGGRMIADAFPIGIDVDEVQQAASHALATKKVRKMAKSLDDRDLLIGVDRLDYSKGLRKRFKSYERLLLKYPNCQNSLVFMQIAPPTRVGVRTYDDIRSELEQETGRINGRFADTDWVPIRYLNKGIDRNTLMGFFRVATSALVTPVRDGMNLVAKEFVAAQDPENPGIPVVSSLAGAAWELDAAIIVNPYDKDDVADGIASAITMSLEERRERYESMIATLRHNDIHAWRTRFVQALDEARAKPS